MTAREYKLYLTREQKWMLALPAIMFTLFPLPFFFMLPATGKELPDFFPLIFLAFAAAYWYDILTVPSRIIVSPTGQLEFVSFLRRHRVAVGDVVSIGPGRAGFVAAAHISRFRLTHRAGKLGFINQFTGMHEFLLELRRDNPTVALVGC